MKEVIYYLHQRVLSVGSKPFKILHHPMKFNNEGSYILRAIQRVLSVGSKPFKILHHPMMASNGITGPKTS